jgi:hypothetical protein
MFLGHSRDAPALIVWCSDEVFAIGGVWTMPLRSTNGLRQGPIKVRVMMFVGLAWFRNLTATAARRGK